MARSKLHKQYYPHLFFPNYELVRQESQYFYPGVEVTLMHRHH
jgi:hypothetical protein